MKHVVLTILIWILLAACHDTQTTVPVKVPSGYLYKAEPGIPGKAVYICGERPFNDTGDLVGLGDLGAQTRRVFDNIKTSLATVGMGLTDIAQITYSIKEPAGVTQVSTAKLQIVKTVEAAYFAKPPQINEAKSVAQTVREDVLIEIEVVAIK